MFVADFVSNIYMHHNENHFIENSSREVCITKAAYCHFLFLGGVGSLYL